MSPSTKVWFGTFSALVFSTGILGGLILDRTWLIPPPAGLSDQPPRGPGGGPRGGFGATSAEVAEMTVNRLDRDLHFTADQRRDLLALFESWDARVRKTQDVVQQQFRDEQQTLRQDVMKLLTPEQAKRFDELGPRALPSAGRGRPGGPARGGPGRGRDFDPPPLRGE